jgi:hypothetical protein
MPNQTVLVIQQLAQMKFADMQRSPHFNLKGKFLQTPTWIGCQVDAGDAPPGRGAGIPCLLTKLNGMNLHSYRPTVDQLLAPRMMKAVKPIIGVPRSRACGNRAAKVRCVSPSERTWGQ